MFAKKQALFNVCGLLQYYKSSYQSDQEVHHYQKRSLHELGN